MPFTVEITLADLPSEEGEHGIPMYPLSDTFDTVAEAKDAAAAHVADLDRDPATVLFAIMDQKGLTIMTSMDTEP